MSTEVVVALIGLPTSVIGALAAWRASKHSQEVKRRVDTGNGVTLGHAVVRLQQEVKNLRLAFYDHAGDPEAHR